jgi:hypothetical protein
MFRNGVEMPIVSTVDTYEDNMDPDIHDEPESGKCPICGQYPEWMYVDEWGEVVGCDLCLKSVYVGEP